MTDRQGILPVTVVNPLTGIVYPANTQIPVAQLNPFFGTRTAGAALPSRIEKLPNGDGFQYARAGMPCWARW
jgi:hypothetical protein